MIGYPAVSPIAPSNRTWLGSAADRRMCAGTYLDPDFRDHVLRGVYNERGRRVAPSYGCDIVPVLRHAWRAWWLEMCQHLVILAVLGISLALRPLDTLLALDLLVIGYLLRFLAGWAAQNTGYGNQKNAILLQRQLEFRGKVLKNCLTAAFLALLALVAVSAHEAGAEQPLSSWLARTALDAAETVAALAGIVAVAAMARVICLRRLHAAARSHWRLSGRMQVIDKQQRHPFTVYTGDEPFIGSGNNMRSWSFAQRLVRASRSGVGPSDEFDDPPFTTQKLVDRLRERISALRDETNPEISFPGLNVADRVFVQGTLAGRYGDVLASDPDSSDVEREIARAIANPSDVARHYLTAWAQSWAGEIVTTVFVHASLQGRTLYLEFATCALLPTRSEYHVVDKADGTGSRAIMKAAGTGLASLPQQLLAARRLAGVPTQLGATLRGRDWTPKRGRRFDIGAVSSAREQAMTGADVEAEAEAESTYFQYQDFIQHSKIIERRLIATVDDYLTELGVDTSEFLQRATAILNSGVIINTGPGPVNFANSAIGGEKASISGQAGRGEG
jgi:hypothetical protein